MNLKKLILKENNCYKAGEKLEVKGLMLHSTGANNPNLRRYIGPDDGQLGVNDYGNHWNQPRPDNQSKCVHGFIGKLKDGTIATYQTLPWEIKAWHGGGTANSTHIGIEICEDNLKDATYFNQVYREAVELFAYLCKEFKLDPLKDGVIICHSEGAKRGIASNHGDVMHWFPKHGKSMDTFRKDVQALLKPATEPPAKPATSTTTKYTPVKDHQAWLKKRFGLKLDADNIWGPITNKETVRAMQKLTGPEKDGIWGPITAKHCPCLGRGDEGDLVTLLQGVLAGKFGYTEVKRDGDFGPITDAAVKKFQRAHGLTADGLAGVLTFKALLA